MFLALTVCSAVTVAACGEGGGAGTAGPEARADELAPPARMRETPGAVLAEAQALLRGGDNAAENVPVAVELLYRLAVRHKYVPAYFPFAMAVRDDEICADIGAVCGPWRLQAPFYIIDAAHAEDVRAQRYIVDHVQDVPDDYPAELTKKLDYSIKHAARYYWMRRLIANGGDVEPGELDDAAAALAPDVRELMEDWAADPSHRPAHTRLPDMP